MYKISFKSAWSIFDHLPVNHILKQIILPLDHFGLLFVELLLLEFQILSWMLTSKGLCASVTILKGTEYDPQSSHALLLF